VSALVAGAGGRVASLVMFLAIVAVTLLVTWRVARRARTASGYYAAGRGVAGWQNGFAIMGDLFSAAAFLGITGITALYGFDGVVYSMGFVVGLICVLLVIAEPLRNLGHYTMTDVLAYRLRDRPVRGVGAGVAITIVLFSLVAQMVGAGVVAGPLLGISTDKAIIVVGIVMIAYVSVGGMMATTYVQIIKAVLLAGICVGLTVLVLAWFGFDLSELLGTAAAHSGKGEAFLLPGLRFTNDIDLISLAVGLMFGTAGLPYVLMRFYTVPDARVARQSGMWAVGVHGLCMFLVTVLGMAAAALIGSRTLKGTDPTGNATAPLLAQYLGGGAGSTGGNLLTAVVSAAAVATILAVVAGLTMSAAASISHDLYAHVLKRGRVDERRKVRVGRVASLGVGAAAIALALSAKSLNVAFLIGLANTLAASACFPVLVYSLYWRRFTTSGALCALVTGLVTTVGLAAVSPAFIGPRGIVLTGVEPLVGIANPGIISVPAAFLAGWLGTVLSRRDPNSESGFRALRLRALTGYGAAR
jgi:cation/acetate symporter